MSREESLLDDEDDDEDLHLEGVPMSLFPLDGELAADLRADMLGFPALPELACFGDDVPCFGLTLAGITDTCLGLL